MWRWSGSASRADKKRARSAGPELDAGKCSVDRGCCFGGEAAALKPISEDELRVLEDLEGESADRWTELKVKEPAHKGAKIRLLCRESSASAGSRTSVTELRAFLILPISAAAAFEHVYTGAFLRSCYPSWGFEVSAASVASGNDAVRIGDSSGRLELLRWRRMREDDSGVRTWLLRPADPSAVPLAQLDLLGRTAAYSTSRLSVASIADLFMLSDIANGFVLRPLSETSSVMPELHGQSCRLFLYVRLPGVGFVLRAALAKFCPGPLKRLCNDLCSISSGTPLKASVSPAADAAAAAGAAVAKLPAAATAAGACSEAASASVPNEAASVTGLATQPYVHGRPIAHPRRPHRAQWTSRTRCSPSEANSYQLGCERRQSEVAVDRNVQTVSASGEFIKEAHSVAAWAAAWASVQGYAQPCTLQHSAGRGDATPETSQEVDATPQRI